MCDYGMVKALSHEFVKFPIHLANLYLYINFNILLPQYINFLTVLTDIPFSSLPPIQNTCSFGRFSLVDSGYFVKGVILIMA